MSDPAFHEQNRERLVRLLRDRRAAGLFFTSAHKVRNHDCEYRFRPESDFWWLTGFAEPESALLLLPTLEGQARPRQILYLRDRDREREIWTGRRLGVTAAPSALRVDEARPIERLWDDLPTLLKNQERIVTRTGLEPERDRQLLETLTKLRWAARGMVVPPLELLDVAPFTHELRLFKTERELEHMRRAAGISRAAHSAAMRASKPGLNECELDALLEHEFRRRGSTGAAYTNIVAGGANACILHYVENDQPLRDGELVLIDAGAEWEYYASDVTRTFPVNGRFSAEQKALYEVVLQAQLTAIAHVRPGVSFVSVHEVALRALVEGFVRLGLLVGKAEELLANEGYRRFYMHRTSHWLGLDVHDCGAYVRDGASRLLEPGMVLTVEPGCYVAPDDESVPSRWRGIGIRIEDDVLVTPAGHEVLTAGIPKTVEEVEAACAGRTLAGAT
ncbi:MAG: aminopeptidase P N-terminal domain-containing protein [Planctomycetes bacterium]|nr:aminopeptidase P N-terminal domain-containing protein [Planctomycetota bacterium]